MTERRTPSISISCDDLNTNRGLDNIARIGLPIHGDVIVTFPGVGRFVAENRKPLAKVEPGVHISLFEGEFPMDGKGLFGPRGRLHHLLHAFEDPRRGNIPRYRHWFNFLRFNGSVYSINTISFYFITDARDASFELYCYRA